MGGKEKLEELVTEYTRGLGLVKHMILHHFANKAAENDHIMETYLNSYTGVDMTDGGVDSPVVPIYDLPHPSFITTKESDALKYVFEQLINNGVNGENGEKN